MFTKYLLIGYLIYEFRKWDGIKGAENWMMHVTLL